MGKGSKQPAPQKTKQVSKKTWKTALPIGTAIAILSLWFTYTLNLPALSTKATFLQPLSVGPNIPFKINLTNDGKTTARHLNGDIRVSLQESTLPFEAAYPGTSSPKHSSELNAGSETTLYSDQTFNFTDAGQLDAVMTDRYRLYIFGRMTYLDILGLRHEYHFCRFYRPIATTDLSPLTLYQCTEYNETLSTLDSIFNASPITAIGNRLVSPISRYVSDLFITSR